MLGRDGDWASVPAFAAAALQQKILTERPKVVNISQDFALDIADCEQVFGGVFSHFGDSVLFVTAAGNDGLRNAPDVCPASLARKFKNVISVGGVDTLGDAMPSRFSNYGRDFVDIAAPYCVESASFIDHDVANTRVCGTSFAAPVIANAALGALTQLATLSPAELKSLLTSSCRVSGLDVACGGALDPEKLVSNLVLEAMERGIRLSASAPTYEVKHD